MVRIQGDNVYHHRQQYHYAPMVDLIVVVKLEKLPALIILVVVQLN
jgi:hypothetical protein